MRIVVGLGNPGREYASTRHNFGFMVVDELARRHGKPSSRKRFRSEIAETSVSGTKLVLVKPQTFMNLSGHAVREVVNWYHVSVEDLIVVVDELALPFGMLRLRANGSAGGHNGLTSVIEQLGTTQVTRLRIGIGQGRSGSIAHVLSRFSPEEERALPNVVNAAADGVERWLEHGVIDAMNHLNRKIEESPAE